MIMVQLLVRTTVVHLDVGDDGDVDFDVADAFDDDDDVDYGAVAAADAGFCRRHWRLQVHIRRTSLCLC